MSDKFRLYGWSGDTEYTRVRVLRAIDDGNFTNLLFGKKHFEAIAKIADLVVTNFQRFYFTEIQDNMYALRSVDCQ